MRNRRKEAHEELSQRKAARHDWLEEWGAQDRSITGRCYQRIADLRVSTTGPDATIMLHKDGSHLGYQTHYVVDEGAYDTSDLSKTVPFTCSYT